MQQRFTYKRIVTILLVFVTVITLLGASLPTLTHAANRSGDGRDDSLAQTLPVSPFYAWAYSPSRDTMVLLNANGLAATIPRPKLPNEVASLETPPMMSFSPDGQMLVLAAPLSNGQDGLGFYNLATGQFVQTHMAQPNESIFLGSSPGLTTLFPEYAGSPYAFTTDSTRVAIGLAQMITAAAWRVIVFNAVNGQVQATLDNTNTLTHASVSPTQAWFPRPMAFLGSGAEAQIHLQFILGFTGGSSQYPALAWNPTTGTIAISNLVFSTFDIQPAGGVFVFPNLDPTIPALEPIGPGAATNVIQRDAVTTGPSSPVTLYTDSANYLGGTSWAANGQLVLFTTSKPDYVGGQVDFWVLSVSTGAANQLPSDTRSVYPTSEGFLRVDSTGQVFRHGLANPTGGQLLWQSNDPDLRLLWSNPAGSTFRLSSVFSSTPSSGGTALCTGAPVSRVTVGQAARVTISNSNPSPLRMRSAPGGTFIVSLPEGTQFTIQGGPQCQGGYTWWQIRLSDGRTGWVAEGSQTGYFIEPLTASPIPVSDARVNTTRLNVRQSPGTGAAVIGILNQNDGVKVLGRLADNSWVQVQTATGVTGWVLAQYLTFSINLNTVPIVNTGIVNPPLPTATIPIVLPPTATLPLVPPDSPFNVFITADTYSILAGQCATISWNVTGASQVLFDGAFVNPVDARVVCPGLSTTYTLQVTQASTGLIQSYPVLITVTSGY